MSLRHPGMYVERCVERDWNVLLPSFLQIHYRSFDWRCQSVFGSLSNCVETATRWHKSQEHLSPVNLHISQTIGDALEHLDLGVTPFGEAVRGAIIKVI